MNTAFNSALKQSTSIRKELAQLSSAQNDGPPTAMGGSGSGALTPAALGSLSASVTAFSRTLDQYNQLAKQELNPTKKEKAFSRLSGFHNELAEYRAQLEALKAARESAVHGEARGELLGRRPYVSATPENPYSDAAMMATARSSYDGGGYGHARNGSSSFGSTSTTTVLGSGDVTREEHALREQSFISNTHATLDDYIARGQAVLDNLGVQRETLKNTQKRLYSAANTLGVSRDTIRMVERRAREDKWIFWAGVVVFFGFCWLCLHFLR